MLEESDGALWWIEDPTGAAATYKSICSSSHWRRQGSDTGGAAAWPRVLGGLAVAGGIAIAAGTGGGGGGGDDDNNSPNPGNPEILPSQIPRLRMPPPIYRSHLTAKPSPVPLSRAARLP